MYFSNFFCRGCQIDLILFLQVVITFAILIQTFGNSALVAVGLFLLVVPLQVACGLVISALQKRKKVSYIMTVFVFLFYFSNLVWL